MATAGELVSQADKLPRPDGGSAQGLRWDDSVGLAPLGFGSDAEPVVLDWFGGGNPDLLLSAVTGAGCRRAQIYRFLPRNADKPDRYEAGVPVEALDGLRFLCPIGNDSESHFDLVAFDETGLVRLPNIGKAGSPEFGAREPLGIAANLGRDHVRIAQMVAVDWDGDGLPDLLVGLDDLTGYWPEGDKVPPEQHVGFNQRGGHPGYDRSGRWRGQPARGCIVLLKNTGSLGAPQFVVQEDMDAESGAKLDLAARPAPLAMSWSSPGTWEMVLADSRGELRAFRNFGSQRPPVLMDARPILHQRRPWVLPDDRTVLIAADMDRDRRDEIVFGTASGHVFAIHAASARDEAEAPRALVQENPPFWLCGHAVLAAGDLDADGDMDLLAGDGLGTLHWVRDQGGPGDHRYALPVPLEAGGEPFRLDPGTDGMLQGPAAPRLGLACPAIVDWVPHGKIDVLVSGAGGDVLVLRNNGVATDPRFDSPKPLRCEGHPLIIAPRVRPAAADWFGSGAPDFLAVDLQGFLCVYRRTGSTEVAPPVPLTDRLGRFIRLDGGFGLAGGCALWAGPWTGSGHVDLLVGLPRGCRFVIPPLLGRPLDDLDQLPTVLLLENQGRSGLVARPIRTADGQPLVLGKHGCSPSAVDGRGNGTLDLVVGCDDGQVMYFRREELSW